LFVWLTSLPGPNESEVKTKKIGFESGSPNVGAAPDENHFITYKLAGMCMIPAVFEVKEDCG
jgi:hypothetical protein